MGTNKMDELDNKYGKFAWRKDRSILAQNAEEQLLNLTLQIDEAAYKGVRKQTFDKNGKAVGMMGGKMFFIHEAQKKHPEICIDASSEATGDYPWIKNGVFQNPSVAQVLNFAIASAKACGGGNFDTILINPLDATAWAETTQCKDFCNVSPMDTNAGSAGKTTFSTNVPGFMGRRMKIEALEIIPRGEILIGDSSSCELLPVEGCPMEFVELTNYDPRCPDYVIDVSLSMRVTNPKCNWRRIKNLVIC